MEDEDLENQWLVRIMDFFKPTVEISHNRKNVEHAASCWVMQWCL